MNITEKILAKHCGKKFISAGEFISAKIDLILANDVTAPISIQEFSKLKKQKVLYPDKVVFVLDHFVPAKDIKSAENCRMIKEFSAKHKIKKVYDIQDGGIEHCLLPQEKLIYPGQLVIGADSHTCTYGAYGVFATGVGSTDITYALATGKSWFMVPHSLKINFYGKLKKWVEAKDLILHLIGKIGVDGALYQAMEFCGEAISALSIDERSTLCNMVIEAGGKSGIVTADKTTFDFMKNIGVKINTSDVKNLFSDKDAEYKNIIDIDVSKIDVSVALPHLPSNVKPVKSLKNIYIQQAVIGSCTNGKISDLRRAAKILKGKKVAKGVRLIIFPATQKIYAQALKEGLLSIFAESGAIISTPTCGPCLGGHMGILAKGEKCIATTNRNFVGRMGHTESEVYLANVSTTAASAIKGKIVHPEEVL